MGNSYRDFGDDEAGFAGHVPIPRRNPRSPPAAKRTYTSEEAGRLDPAGPPVDIRNPPPRQPAQKKLYHSGDGKAAFESEGAAIFDAITRGAFRK